MHPFSLFLASTLGVAVAYKAPHTPEGFCMTVFGTESLKTIPTSTSRCHNNHLVHVTKTAQKKVTITPKPSTTTTTSTAITIIASSIDPRTDVVEIVATEYDTSTITEPTSTRTSTITVSTGTIVTSTSTIEAPVGFRPIQDTIDGSRLQFNQAGTPSKRWLASRAKRHSGSGAILNIDLDTKGKNHVGYKQPSSHPQKVNCFVTVNVSKTITLTKTGPAITVTAVASTKIATNTKLITSVSTIIPEGITVFTTSTTTSTIKEAIIPYTTTTTTTLSTVTVQVPGPTVHSICEGRNYADSLNGAPFVSVVIKDPIGYSYGSAGSAYECCERCASLPNCVFSYAFDQGEGCALALQDESGTCSEQDICTGIMLYETGPNSRGVVIASNGRAFHWTEAEPY